MIWGGVADVDGGGGTTRGYFPESEDPQLKLRSNSAIVFSGGGTRAYTCALGYIRALHDLGLMDRVRHITGISGGSWATSVYTYAQLGLAPGVATTMEELLGDIADPASLTMDNLENIPEMSARMAPTRSLVELVLKAYKKSRWNEAWVDGVSQMFLEPVGVPPNAVGSWNASILAAIKERNPAVANITFVIPPGPRPFWHAGAALIGPQQLQPTPYVNSSFSMIEGTPLYVGIPYVKNITYRNKEHPGNQQTFTVGGMVEPFAAGTAGPPPGTESVRAASGAEYTTVLQPDVSATVAVIAAASSEFYGPAIASILPKLSHAMDINYTYWSPQQPAAQASPSMLLGDGGCYENQLVIAMIQRRVQNIVVFASSDAPLAPKEKWDPTVTPPDKDDYISNEIPSYFGVGTGSANSPGKPEFGYDYTHNQVFDSSDFVDAAVQLQTTMAGGKGCYAVQTLTTVENKRWSIPAGIVVNVTWVYLSRLEAWENQLVDEVKKHVTPTFDPSDPAKGAPEGPFHNFPHYQDVSQLELSPEQTNLLADLTGWMVMQNKDVFQRALQ